MTNTTRSARWLLLALAILLLIAVAPHARAEPRAHPADMFFHQHDLVLTPDGLTDTWIIAPGPLLAFTVWEQADADRDGAVSESEARAWAEDAASQIVTVVNDESALPWAYEGVTWPGTREAFETAEEAVVITLRAAWPDTLPGDSFALTFANRFVEDNSINWFTLAAEAGAAFDGVEQVNGLLTLDVALAGAGEEWLTEWDSATLAFSGGGAIPQSGGQTSTTTLVTDLLRDDELTPLLIPVALIIAAGLGALHALTPGHGKTLVAAYLVGTRGTTRHAVALGGVVTLTHTGSVLALGGITLLASRFLLPTTLFPILELASGLLVLVMGLSLLRWRWIGWRSVQKSRARAALSQSPPSPGPSPTEREGKPPQPGSLSPSPGVSPSSGGKKTIAIGQPIETRDYDRVLPQDDGGFGRREWRSLIALGISGGLVPCPDAIAILLVAIAINRLALGLSMIVAFSAGLAAILIAIGLAMVHSRRLFGRLEGFTRLAPALSVGSAVIVLLLGLALTASALSNTGLFDAPDAPGGSSALAGLNLDAPRPFALETASVLYLGVDETDRTQLYLAPATGTDEPLALTQDAIGVWDVALAPDARAAVYTVADGYRGSSMWLVGLDGGEPQLLLDCPDLACSRPIWSANGARILYERTELASSEAELGLSALWWVIPDTGETGPVFADAALPGFNAALSPDGAWLSYTAPLQAGTQVTRLDGGGAFLVPNQTGNAALWSPSGETLIIMDIRQVGALYLSHLLRVDVATQAVTDITAQAENDAIMEDSVAAWSPDGAWLAVVRRAYTSAGTQPGNQLWVMRPDGSAARQLTNTERALHNAPVWSPDGRYLLYHAYALGQPYPEPEIWTLDVETGEQAQVAVGGTSPAWVP